MDIHTILEYLPHRYPFLLVDRVTAFEPGFSLTALKNVSINEPFFQGHFPVKPVMPGVMIIEALAQATGLLALESTSEEKRKTSLYYFVGIDKARFKMTVEPGDQIVLHVEKIAEKRGIWKFSAKATVEGKLAASAEIMCTSKDI